MIDFFPTTVHEIPVQHTQLRAYLVHLLAPNYLHTFQDDLTFQRIRYEDKSTLRMLILMRVIHTRCGANPVIVRRAVIAYSEE